MFISPKTDPFASITLARLELPGHKIPKPGLQLKFSLYLYRMKGWLLILLALLPAIAQSQDADSLKNIILKTRNSDTNKVHALVDLAAIHFHDNLDSSRLLITQALKLAKKQNYKRGIGFSNTAKSGYFFQKGELDSALIYANRGAKILKSVGDQQHILAAYNNMALIYNNMDKPEEAIKIYLKIYRLIENQETSIQHMAICNNLAVAYSNNQQLRESKKWFQKVIKYAHEMKHPMGLVYGLNGTASVNLDLDELDEAIDHSTEALRISLENGMDKTVIESYQNLGKAYSKLGKHDLSNSYLNKGLELARKFDSKQNLQVIYQYLAQNHKQQGKHQTALEYNELYHAIKDSIFSQDKVELIEELEKKYETATLKRKQTQLEFEKELQGVKAKRNRNYLIIISVIVVLLSISGILYFLQFKNRKKAELNRLELTEQNKRLLVENQYKDSELKAIKAQMNPHFIFNALNSIQEYIILNEKELASDYLGKFADLIRLYLNQSNQTLITIEEEIKSLQLYIELEALRQEGLEFEIKCEDEFLLEKNLPPMLIQPYVENAIKHGLWHKQGVKRLEICFYEKNELIVCEVSDNGIGLRASKKINDQKNKHRSFSTDANASRLQIIQEKHGNQLSISIEEKVEQDQVLGTRVQIQIPNTLV
ncbi:MAG: tetratricopeptide repeat protein [Bacteroidetes bacterium]|nr:MAG: tetratricopeptide repeat protein [Bacteroidota bacterium]